MPVYPDGARTQAFEATVVTQVVVDSEGCVTNVKLLADSDHEFDSAYEFDHSTLKIQETWVFRPAFAEGEPVAIFQNLTTYSRLR